MSKRTNQYIIAALPKLFEDLEKRTGTTEPVPDQPPYPRTAPKVVRSYMLTLEPDGHDLNPKLMHISSNIPKGNSLELNVPKGDCVFEISLDSQWNWTFVPSPIRLGTISTHPPAPSSRYYGLVLSEDKMKATFNAIYNPRPKQDNWDPFNIHVVLNERGAVSILIIDPDIKNPGDNVRLKKRVVRRVPKSKKNPRGR